MSILLPKFVMMLSLMAISMVNIHSAGSEEVAHVSFLIRICTIYTFTYSYYFYGTRSMGSDEMVYVSFLCPQRNFGRHIVIALSVPPCVRPAFVSGPYLLYSLR